MILDFLPKKLFSKDNKIMSLILYTPASIISSILVPIMIIVSIPTLLLSNKKQKSINRVLLYIQHSISLSWPYVLYQYYFLDSFNLLSVIAACIVMLLLCLESIKEMVEETSNKL